MPSFPIIGWPSWEPPAPSEGPPGPPGPAGAAGPTGRRGYGTALQAVYEFVGSDPSPEAGALSIEVADPVWDSTWARLAFLDDGSVSRVTEIIGMADSTNPVKGTLRIEAITDPSRWATFDLTDVAPNNVDHYCSLDVENGNAWDGSAFTVGERVAVTFSRAGDKGDGSAVPDASGSTKGIMKLAGDLGGTADLPTVPGLASKLGPASGTPDGSKFLRDDLSWQVVSGGGPSIDTDPTFAANSDLVVPSQKAVRTALDRQPFALMPPTRFGAGSFLGTRLTGIKSGATCSVTESRSALGMTTLRRGTIQELAVNILTALPAGQKGDICCYSVDGSGFPALLQWTQQIPLDTTGDVAVTGLNLPIPNTGKWAFALWSRPGNGGPVVLTGADAGTELGTQTYSGATMSYQLRPSNGILPPDLTTWPAQGGSGINVLGGFSVAPMILARGVSA